MFFFNRQNFTRAPLNSWEAAVVREAGQKLVGALERASALSFPAVFADR